MRPGCEGAGVWNKRERKIEKLATTIESSGAEKVAGEEVAAACSSALDPHRHAMSVRAWWPANKSLSPW